MIVTLAELRQMPAKLAVLVTGGFDPLHFGHVRYFEAAAEFSTPQMPLVVGVAPDSYVARKHPVFQPIEHRMEIIDAIQWVDIVVPQEEETAASLIRALRPKIFIKGDDWKERGLPEGERKALEEVGAEVRYVPVHPVKSSDLLYQFAWSVMDQMGRS